MKMAVKISQTISRKVFGELPETSTSSTYVQTSSLTRFVKEVRLCCLEYVKILSVFFPSVEIYQR